MEDPSAWSASGWLGLMTAGSLWTPLYQDEGFEDNVSALVSQVKIAVPDFTLELAATVTAGGKSRLPAAGATAGAEDDELFTRDELRAELERLRKDAFSSRCVQRA